MPKEKDEDWRYTHIGNLKIENFENENSEVNIKIEADFEELKSKGVILSDINSALDKYPAAQNYFFRSSKTDKDKFVAMCASQFTNGIYLYIPKNAELSGPIKANFNFGKKKGVIHNLIICEANAKIDFIEEYSNDATNSEQLHSCITEVFADNNSKINFFHMNRWTDNVYNFTNIVGSVERDASINWVSGSFGGKLNRLRIDTMFNGQGSYCNNLGVFLGKGKEHIDITTNVYHNVDGTTNDILVDGILRGESSSVYRGLIKIEKEGQKTNSYLANHILKLGDKTLANSIPSLKIDANDVKASHGATVGQINEEHLFYLMSRGLPRDEAESMITQGFLEPIICKIK